MNKKINWIGPIDGLGGRLLCLGAILSLSKILDVKFAFPWPVNNHCPANYYDLFDEMPGIEITAQDVEYESIIGTNQLGPMGILKDINTALGSAVSAKEFLFHFASSFKSMRFNKSVLSKLESHLEQIDLKNNIALHVRRTDRIQHLRKTLRKFLVGKSPKLHLQMIRNNGVAKTIQYSLLPSKAIVRLENIYLAKKLNSTLDLLKNPTFTIYADSADGLFEMKETLSNYGVSPSLYVPSYCDYSEGKWNPVGIRHTSVQAALVEILTMSRSAAILQNNPASAFSMVSSLIGNVEIVTPQPARLFWKLFIECFGHPPSSPIAETTAG